MTAVEAACSSAAAWEPVRQRRMAAIERSQRINEQIRITPVRVIGADGQQLGIMPTEQALSAAREADLDLVEVAPTERPPVCRIMDFGKFKYQLKKKQHKGHMHQAKIKEIRVRPKTDDHDIEVKVGQSGREFLGAQGQGDCLGDLPRSRAGPRRRRPKSRQPDRRHLEDVGQGRNPAQSARPPDRLRPAPR